MTSDQWHEPNYPPPAPKPSKEQQLAIDNMKTICAVAKAAGCGYIFHDDPKDPYAKHYPISKKEKDEIDGDYNAMSQDLTGQQNPVYFTEKYGPIKGRIILRRGDCHRKAKDAGASSIAHRTPRAGGGCPIGEGNLKPVEPKCHGFESAAGKNQGQIGAYHRKVHKL